MIGWADRTVDEICSRITSGGTPSRKVSEYFNGSIPWLKTQEIQDKWVYQTSETISESGLASSSAKLLPKNTVLLAMYGGGTVGNVALVGRQMACNQAACAMIVDPEKADFRFLFYLLLNDRQRIVGLANGAAQQNLNSGIVKSLDYKFPSLPEQHGIAATLGALDDKIESNRRSSEVASGLIDALAQHMLKEQPVRTARLVELVEFNTITRRPDDPSGEISYVDIASVSPGRVDSVVITTWDNAPGRARRGVSDGDVIYSTVRPGRRSFSVILDPDKRTVVSTGFAVMSPGASLGTSLLTTVAGSAEFAAYLESVAHGSAYPAVSVDAMGNYEIAVPVDTSVVIDFEAKTMPLRRRVHHMQVESSSLAALRDALLPELLSGRIRVPEAKQAVAEVVA